MDTTCTTIDILVPLYINHPSLYPIVTEFFESLKLYDYNVIAIDDNSPLPHNFPVTLRNKHNLGFTGTVNRLLELSKADVMVIANDDLKFKPGDLDRFKDIKDGIHFPSDSASGNLKQFGAIWGMNRNTFNKLGYLDESLPHYGSDREYYDRAIKLGIPIVNWSDICITHRESATYKHTNLK